MKLNRFLRFLKIIVFIFLGVYLVLFLGNFSNFNLLPKAEICGRFPTEEHITVDNLIWQILELPKGFMNILNAYLDLRQNQSAVRINVISVLLNESDVFHCQFWFNDKHLPTVVKAREVLLMWVFGTSNEKVKYPYLIECPFEGIAPSSVSLVVNSCDFAENNLKILNPQPVDGVKKRFGVCTKKARFDDRVFTMRFIEWVHMMLLFGAEKIHLPYEFVHPEMFKVLNYFEEEGIVETWQYLDPSGVSDLNYNSWQSYQLEVNTQTDCFYRAKNLYDFIAIIDIDELIMPVIPEDMTWEDIMKRVNGSQKYDAFISQNVYYPEIEAKLIDEIPKFMYMLQHIQRSQNFSDFGNAVKSIVSTKNVMSIHTHMPQQCITGIDHYCEYFDFPTNISQNSHYRDHVDQGTNFNVTREDKTLWKYKDKLIEAVKRTLIATQFVP